MLVQLQSQDSFVSQQYQQPQFQQQVNNQPPAYPNQQQGMFNNGMQGPGMQMQQMQPQPKAMSVPEKKPANGQMLPLPDVIMVTITELRLKLPK